MRLFLLAALACGAAAGTLRGAAPQQLVLGLESCDAQGLTPCATALSSCIMNRFVCGCCGCVCACLAVRAPRALLVGVFCAVVCVCLCVSFK